MKQPVERRLAAILAADVAAYSRLMGADEEGTLEGLKAHRRELIDPEQRGRIVKTTGDGMLVEFPSVVDAVRCAAELQRGMVDRNADLPDARRIAFRIGINLGDIIADGRDIYGDGVNIAARLEALAEPGGICISRGARRDPRQAPLHLRGSRRAERQEHCAPGARLQIECGRRRDVAAGRAARAVQADTPSREVAARNPAPVYRRPTIRKSVE
jgi:adenylate cyclase